MAKPTPADVSALLATAGVPSGTFTDSYLQSQIAAAVAALDAETGYHPFYPEPLTLALDPPNSSLGYARVTARGGLVRLPSALLGASTALTVGGAAPLANSVFPSPSGGRALALNFVTATYGVPGSVSLSGTFGYATTIPADVDDAVLKLAAGMVLASRREGILGSGVGSYEEGGVKESVGYELTNQIGQGWAGSSKDRTGPYAVFDRYKRVDYF